MHLIDITGAIACHRHTNSLALTAGVDSLDFLHPVKVGDIIILKSRVTCTFRTSLEVEVEVFSEGTTTGERKLTSHAFLTFVSLDGEGKPKEVPPLIVEGAEDEERCRQAHARRAERLARKSGRAGRSGWVEERRPIDRRALTLRRLIRDLRYLPYPSRPCERARSRSRSTS